ncbi:Pre-mRNA-splicing factor PRP46 [Mycena venus]|uniref:Pre-mRNA-splicing factor PRP46 n=1 Tax=Mycena venus TaxID=2733690 RepID=A0A8H6Y9B0_9AGAR|nr:Pre-mRNA-splicing factor PRP46 [Mycena venus]
MVRGLAVSPRHPYLFSCGEGKKVQCWNLEANIITGISLESTPCPSTLPFTSSPPPTATPARVWDVLTKAQIHILSGHTATVADVKCHLGDLAAGKTHVTLMHYKKSIHTLAIHPTDRHNAIINTLSVNAQGIFFSGADNESLSFWDYNTGTLFQNMEDVPQPGMLEAEAAVFCLTFD